MKKLITLIILFISVYAIAQENSTGYIYAELVGTGKLFSKKVTVEIDYGQESRFFAYEGIVDENGKPKVFNSMVDALNFMGSQGWEFVQAYVVTVGNSNVYHWLLKRPKEGLEESFIPKTTEDLKQEKKSAKKAKKNN